MDSKANSSEESDIKPPESHQASKRRKVVEKSVVTVKIGENGGIGNHVKNDYRPPCDLWSWRKYGQKPIKGSPYPRGYYRCSTSKGCSAKKQVERCRTDGSMLVVTYTSTHNHPGLGPGPGPDPDGNYASSQTPKQEQAEPICEELVLENQALKACSSSDEDANEKHFYYLEKTHDDSLGQGLVLDELEPLSCSSRDLTTTTTLMSSTPKSVENDFFDELEELLPISSSSSSFTSFMMDGGGIPS